jgi:hypothetical protein
MTTVLFIDPSSKPKNRGYSLWANGSLIQYGVEVPPDWARSALQIDICAVEDQWANPKASRQSLITLGQYAGFLLGRIPAAMHIAVPVQVWKDRVIPGFANAKKRMFTGNLRQMWPDVEPRLPLGGLKPDEEDPASDILDALGGGASFWTKTGELAYTKAQLKKWEMK